MILRLCAMCSTYGPQDYVQCVPLQSSSSHSLSWPKTMIVQCVLFIRSLLELHTVDCHVGFIHTYFHPAVVGIKGVYFVTSGQFTK